MTVTACRYIDVIENANVRATLKEGEERVLIYCNFDVGEGRVIRCVYKKDLLIEPSTFIGLKFHSAIDLDTTKQPVIKKKLNLVSLFDDEVEEIIEDTQLGLF